LGKDLCSCPNPHQPCYRQSEKVTGGHREQGERRSSGFRDGFGGLRIVRGRKESADKGFRAGEDKAEKRGERDVGEMQESFREKRRTGKKILDGTDGQKEGEGTHGRGGMEWGGNKNNLVCSSFSTECGDRLPCMDLTKRGKCSHTINPKL